MNGPENFSIAKSVITIELMKYVICHGLATTSSEAKDLNTGSKATDNPTNEIASKKDIVPTFSEGKKKFN